MITIDMHVHSTYSDGVFSPEQLVKRARKRGTSLFALTDHDTTAGLERFSRACERERVRGLCGIELSADAPFTLHILGYRFSPASKKLQERLEYVRRARDARNEIICEKLRALGIDVTIEDAAAFSGKEVVGRPHIARLLVARGVVASMGEAFEKYLSRGALAYAPRERLTPDECISLVREAGGVAVLAHPAQCRMEDDELERLLVKLKDTGLWGMEAVYGANLPEVTFRHLRLADKVGLYTTAGSDFHGKNGGASDVGMTVDDDILPWARLGAR